LFHIAGCGGDQLLCPIKKCFYFDEEFPQLASALPAVYLFHTILTKAKGPPENLTIPCQATA
jgi:hypothetical protein